MTIDRLTPFELMEKLVSFPTVSRDSNLDLVDWVEDYPQITWNHIHRKYDETGEKVALVAHVGQRLTVVDPLWPRMWCQWMANLGIVILGALWKKRAAILDAVSAI